MAKGDFVFAGVDTSSYDTKTLTAGKHKTDGGLTNGLTLVFLFVTVELKKAVPEKKAAKTGGHEGEEEKPPKTTDVKETPPECACKAHISDYSLQVNAYVATDTISVPAVALAEAHELTHVRAKKQDWEAHKTELDTLLDAHSYPCDNEKAHDLIVQDVDHWFQGVFFSDSDEEKGAGFVEEEYKNVAKKNKAAEFMDKIFGKNHMKENGKDARPDKDLPIKDRFSSMVIFTWKGSCGK